MSDQDTLRAAVAELRALAADVGRGVTALWPADVRDCTHTHATLVQAMYDRTEWFVTWQCDDCGLALADRPVTADDLTTGASLPWFDVQLCNDGTERMARSRATTTAFFAKGRAQ